METKILIAIVSISASALIGSLSYFFKNRLISKKKLRTVLYHLLELRYAIQATLIDPMEVTEKYLEHSSKKLNSLGISIEKQMLEETLKDGIYKHFNNILLALKTDIKTQILPPLESSLLELGSIDPLLAYSLRGKEKIEEIINHTFTYSESVVAPEVVKLQKEFSGSFFSESTKKQENDAFNEITKGIDEDILNLSWRCGIFDYIKCKKLLKRQLNREDWFDFSDMDKPIEELIENMLSAINEGKLSVIQNTKESKLKNKS